MVQSADLRAQRIVMRQRALVLFIVGLLFVTALSGQPAKDYRSEAIALKDLFLAQHVSPAPVDDKLSRWVFDSFVQTLDPERLYFTVEDLANLSEYATKLDDELNGDSWKFLPAVSAQYQQNLERSKQIAETLLAKPFDFSEKEVFQGETDFTTIERLRQRWKLKLKYEMLTRFSDGTGGTKKLSDVAKAKESEVRQRVRAAIHRVLNRALKPAAGFHEHLATVYLQTLAVAFDPHSNYLSPTAMENFMSSVSSEGFYFGLVLDEKENGDIVIDQLTPGGPAWKSGVLNGGDVIREIHWEGQEPMELDGISLDEVEDVLLDQNHEFLHLTVSKASGEVKTVSLRKEKMESDDNIVKSVMLRDGQRTIGYISLPGFYTNWGKEGAARCANDVAREILKLKKEKINGIILDLRFNGGGSLMEAVAMAGIFIDAGPVALVKDRTGAIATLKDMNRGTVYDGPLVLMVNTFSASASEILAAALQDYKRALIVGTETYGKSTGQVLFPLRTNVSTSSPLTINPKESFASVTVEKIYRVDGTTAQGVGVQPDIVIPDPYSELGIRERFLPRILPTDSVDKLPVYKALPRTSLTEVQASSEKRIEAKPEFDQIAALRTVLTRRHDKTDKVLLTFDAFEKRNAEAQSVLAGQSMAGHAAFVVGHHAFELQRMQMDSFFAELNKEWVNKLALDFSLAEAFHIICDYVELTEPRK